MSAREQSGASGDVERIARWARIGLSVVLAIAGWHAFHDEYGYVPLIGDIDLAIHEFGHILFQPFGETLAILGGSLTQVAFPCVFLGYFALSRRRRDMHAATACLWWVSINLLSVAIYANDARAGELMLINGQTGSESDAHDWNNLLTRWNALERDHAIADQMRRVAWLLFLLSVTAGFFFVWRQRRRDVGSDAIALD